MISEEVLGLAVERHIVSAEQAAALRALVSERDVSMAEPQDAERLRFVSGFGDIFVTIGLALFIGSFAYFAFQAAGALAMWAATAVAAWLLAEFFTRLRRMALPSIVLLLTFAVASFYGLVVASGAAWPQYRYDYRVISGWLRLDPNKPTLLAMAAFGTAALVVLHYWRFRVPITIAAGTAALIGTALALCLAVMPGATMGLLNVVLLICGVAVFVLAMRFDMSDPLRVTRRTDIAFWLHLLAAPLIVHPLITGLLAGRGTTDTTAAVLILAVFLGLGVVAVLVDRRAMLVSGLTYAGFAFGTLIGRTGLADKTVPATLLALGAFVLLLSAGWRPLRRALLSLMPGGFAQRLPNPAGSS